MNLLLTLKPFSQSAVGSNGQDHLEMIDSQQVFNRLRKTRRSFTAALHKNCKQSGGEPQVLKKFIPVRLFLIKLSSNRPASHGKTFRLEPGAQGLVISFARWGKDGIRLMFGQPGSMHRTRIRKQHYKGAPGRFPESHGVVDFICQKGVSGHDQIRFKSFDICKNGRRLKACQGVDQAGAPGAITEPVLQFPQPERMPADCSIMPMNNSGLRVKQLNMVFLSQKVAQSLTQADMSSTSF